MKLNDIPDVQSAPDARAMPIDKVGIRSIRHPVRVRDRSGGTQGSVAVFNMYVGLPQHFKGTHMSRFVEILNGREHELSVEALEPMVRDMIARLEARTGHLEMRFPYFVNKTAPVSGVSSLMDYEVTLTGAVEEDERFRVSLKVLVPVTSLCPCSKKISAYGAHNQRSHVTVTATLNAHVWIEDIIDLVEGLASCELYGLLKRADEKHVTERAYDNPKFVEDTVRDIAGALGADPRIGHFIVEAENFESIHNHSAYALIERADR